MLGLFNDPSVLTELHSNVAFGPMASALISQVWVAILIYSGPALVSLVYVLIRERSVAAAAQAITPMEAEELAARGIDRPSDSSKAA